MNIINDALSVAIGFFAGHFIANDYTYKHRVYVLERLYYEQSIDYRGRVQF